MASGLNTKTIASHKARARRGSLRDYDILATLMGRFSRQDHLDILKIFLPYLKENPPALADLRKCTSISDKLVQQCYFVRSALQGINEVLSADPKWCSDDPEFEFFLRQTWSYMWQWIDGVFFRDPPFASKELEEYVYLPGVLPLRANLFSLMGRLASTSTNVKDQVLFHHLLGDTPGFIPLTTKWWFDTVKLPCDDISISYSTVQIMYRLTMWGKPEWIDIIMNIVGSPADFAACVLGHIRRLMTEDYALAWLIDDAITMLLSPFTIELHDHLLAQGSLELVLEAIEYFCDAPADPDLGRSLAIYTSLEYLLHLFSSPRGPEQAQASFGERILILVMKSASVPDDSTGLSHQRKLVEILNVLTKYLVYPSNLRTVGKCLAIIKTLEMESFSRGEPTFETAWKHFKASAAEMQSIKAGLVLTGVCAACKLRRERSYFRQCAGCRTYYCNRACQTLDWKNHNHRAVCRRPEIVSDRDFQFLTSLICSKLQEFSREIAFIYQRYILSYMTDDLPPLALVIDCTTYPTTIKAGHPDDYLRPMVVNNGPEYANAKRRLLFENPLGGQRVIVFTEVPAGQTNAHVLIPMAVGYQPVPAYNSYSEFLRVNQLKMGTAKAKEKTKVALKGLDRELEEVERRGKVVLSWISGFEITERETVGQRRQYRQLEPLDID